MESLPIFMKLQGRPAAVIGDTPAARRKAALLERAGARLLRAGSAAGAEEALAGAALAVVDTGDRATDAAVAAQARARGVPVNVVDDEALSTFTFGAIVDRSPVLLAISTGGRSPSLATALRARLEAALPASLGALAEAAGAFREAARQQIPEAARRRRFWGRVFRAEALESQLEEGPSALRSRLLRLINEDTPEPSTGRVLLVGAGPGDPDLLTLRAHRALRDADVIVHDRLVDGRILDHARRDAERIDVGKQAFRPSISQQEIQAILIREARQGKVVVRLKGGDPLIFGRAAEELEALRAADIPVEIVPGITAAIASAAGAGIPLTHRGHASALTLVTGLRARGARQDWRGLTGPGRTLAIYMGVATAEATAQALMEDGFAPQTPVAIVEAAGRPEERHVYGQLVELGALVTAHRVTSPATLLVGDVTALAADRGVQAAPAAREAV